MTLDFWEQLRSSLWEDLPRIIVLLNVSNSFNLGLFTITYVKANYQTNKSPKKRNSEHTLNKNTSHSSLWSLSSFPDCRDITYTHTNKWTHTGYCLFKKTKAISTTTNRRAEHAACSQVLFSLQSNNMCFEINSLSCSLS